VSYSVNECGLRELTLHSWRFMLSLEHVSGEFFTAEMKDIDTHDKNLLRAKFEIGIDGVANQLGIDFVEELGGELIWFQRTDGNDI